MIMVFVTMVVPPTVPIASDVIVVFTMAVFTVGISLRSATLPQLLNTRSLASVQDALCFLDADAAGGIGERASATASVTDLVF